MTDTNQLPEPDHELAELAAMRKAKKITDYKEFIAYYGKQAAYWEQRLKELDMTDTNQQLPSEREAFEAFAQNCPMGKYSIARRGDGYDSSHTQLMWDAWQACTQVQGEPSWWMRETDEGAEWTDTAPLVLSGWTPLYTAPQPAQATQTEVTDSMIREAFLANGFTIKDGHSDLKPYVYAAARAILALRPQAEVTDGIRPEDFTVDVVVKSMGGFAPVNTQGVRVTHKPTGVSVTCDAARSQHANRNQAFETLRAILATPTAQAQPAEVTDEQLNAAYLAWCKTNGTPESFARAILALRPERVPMTYEQRRLAFLASRAGHGHTAFMLGISAAEAHHNITAQAKKEAP